MPAPELFLVTIASLSSTEVLNSTARIWVPLPNGKPLSIGYAENSSNHLGSGSVFFPSRAGKAVLMEQEKERDPS